MKEIPEWTKELLFEKAFYAILGGWITYKEMVDQLQVKGKLDEQFIFHKECDITKLVQLIDLFDNIYKNTKDMDFKRAEKMLIKLCNALMLEEPMLKDFEDLINILCASQRKYPTYVSLFTAIFTASEHRRLEW